MEQKGEAEGLAGAWGICEEDPRRLPRKGDICASQVPLGRGWKLKASAGGPIN